MQIRIVDYDLLNLKNHYTDLDILKNNIYTACKHNIQHVSLFQRENSSDFSTMASPNVHSKDQKRLCFLKPRVKRVSSLVLHKVYGVYTV